MARPLRVTAEPGRTRPVLIRPGLAMGGGTPVVIAGPCSVETPEQIRAAAQAVRRAGARMLRGGAFKPRTSPYSFQGLGEEGLRLLAQAGQLTGLPVVTEVMDPREIDLVARYADLLQVGARNMQNFRLLTALGEIDKPVLLKRGPGATLEEWLNAAEYVASRGNERIILCERGIRTFETYTRYTLDLASAVAAKQLTHLPVIADPSHACGRRELVPAMALAALAAGLDGVMLEVHPDPARALSDGEQALTPVDLERFMAAAGLLSGTSAADSP